MVKIKEEKKQPAKARTLAVEYLKNASSGPHVMSDLCTCQGTGRFTKLVDGNLYEVVPGVG
jgi:hypothetical protein